MSSSGMLRALPREKFDALLHDHGRSIEAFAQFAGHQTDDAGQKMFAGNGHQRGIVAVQPGKLLLGLDQRGVSQPPPIIVERFQSGGIVECLDRIGGAQQFVGQHALAQPTGGIDARPQSEGDGRRVDGSGAQVRHVHERLQTRSLRTVELGQPSHDQRAVLPLQRHHVGHRADGDQIEQLLLQFRCLVRRDGTPRLARNRTQHGLGQPVGHAHAGQIAEAAGAVLALRVDHRQRRRQDRSDRMMVRHDHIQAQLDGALYLKDAANAAIDRHQQAGLARDAFDGLHIEAIALVDTVGNVGTDPSAGHLKRGHQQCSRCDAVGVKIAVDTDGLARFDGLQDACHRGYHVHQTVGILDNRIVVAQEGDSIVCAVQAAIVEHLRQQRVLRHGIEKRVGGRFKDSPSFGRG